MNTSGFQKCTVGSGQDFRGVWHQSVGSGQDFRGVGAPIRGMDHHRYPPPPKTPHQDCGNARHSVVFHWSEGGAQPPPERAVCFRLVCARVRVEGVCAGILSSPCACHTPRVGGRSRVGAPIRGGTRAADGPEKHPKHLKFHYTLGKTRHVDF